MVSWCLKVFFSWFIIISCLLSIQVKFNWNAKFSCLFNILSVGEIYHCGYTCLWCCWIFWCGAGLLSQVSKDGGMQGRFQDVVDAHLRTRLLANSFQSPKVVPTTASLLSTFREEAQRGAQPLESASAGSHTSLTTPVTHHHQPIVNHGPGLGTQLYGVVKTTSSPDTGVTMTAKHPSQMQGSSPSRFIPGNLIHLSLHVNCQLRISFVVQNRMKLNSAVILFRSTWILGWTFQVYLIRDMVTHLEFSSCCMQQTGPHIWNQPAAVHCTAHHLLCRHG